MKRFSYRERDYGFGQAMLTLRTTIGLTQAGLAERLRVSRRAVGEWEAGSSYPKAHHLKAFLALCVQQQVFPPGREDEEIRAYWKAAHQKVLLDEAWLSALLKEPSPPPVLVPVEETGGAEVITAPPAPTDGALASQPGQRPPSIEPFGRRVLAANGPLVDWGEALDVPSFYGRQGELATLAQWVIQERCRVVSVLGLGGIGKSALAVSLMHQVAEHFEVVLWRSLRDAPSCEVLLEECLQVLAPQPLREVPSSLERRLGLLLEFLRQERALVVLDNLESLLSEGESGGHLRPGYEGYGQLLRQVGETGHQSCLLLTSREKPADLLLLEGRRRPVRALRLDGLETDASEQLLAEKEVVGIPQDRARLVEAYADNPLALNIVAEIIVELFGGEIAPFLEHGEVIFGSVRELLDEQFDRLSAAEQTVLLWLAILREPVTLEALLAVLVRPLSRAQVLEAVEALRRRSLLERGKRPGSFTLQAVVLEYATGRLIAKASREIEQGTLSRLIEHGLELATSKDYVRQAQERLIVAPLLAQVQSVYLERVAVEEHLLALLDQMRTRVDYTQGYGPANLLALLRELRGHLRGLNLPQLAIRGAFLQGVEMQDTTLAGATLRETVWTSAFDAIWTVAISKSGQYWAAGSRRGEVRAWREGGKLLHLAWQAHSSTVATLAFSPDEGTLASSGADAVIQLLDAKSGTHLRTLTGHSGPVYALASCEWDHTIWLWDVERSSYRGVLHGHSAGVHGLAFTPDSRSLLSGSDDGTRLASAGSDLLLTLWDGAGRTAPRVLRGHRWDVYGVGWSPDGRFLASRGWDNAVRVWDANTGAEVQILRDPDQVDTSFYGVAWSPDGKFLASGSYQQGVLVWEVTSGTRRWVGHSQPTRIRRVAWSPDGTQLASGGRGRGGSGEIVVWEVSSGQRLQSWSEPSAIVYALAWSPTGAVLLSGSSDGSMRWWDVQNRECLALRQGHQGAVQSLSVSPDGSTLASCGDDGAINIWDLQSGEHLRTLRRERPYERLDISEVKGLTEAQKTTLRALGAMESAPVLGIQHAP
jgi:WD40 repeat protein/transcriptional regulator with XRE-family HTH domain